MKLKELKQDITLQSVALTLAFIAGTLLWVKLSLDALSVSILSQAVIELLVFCGMLLLVVVLFLGFILFSAFSFYHLKTRFRSR